MGSKQSSLSPARALPDQLNEEDPSQFVDSHSFLKENISAKVRSHLLDQSDEGPKYSNKDLDYDEDLSIQEIVRSSGWNELVKNCTTTAAAAKSTPLNTSLTRQK